MPSFHGTCNLPKEIMTLATGGCWWCTGRCHRRSDGTRWKVKRNLSFPFQEPWIHPPWKRTAESLSGPASSVVRITPWTSTGLSPPATSRPLSLVALRLPWFSHRPASPQWQHCDHYYDGLLQQAGPLCSGAQNSNCRGESSLWELSLTGGTTPSFSDQWWSR